VQLSYPCALLLLLTLGRLCPDYAIPLLLLGTRFWSCLLLPQGIRVIVPGNCVS